MRQRKAPRGPVLDCRSAKSAPAPKSMTHQRFTLEVSPTLPPPLRRLAERAANLRFSCHRPTRQLLERLDPDLWQAVSGNPRLFLRSVDQATLDAAAIDADYLAAFPAVPGGFGA